MTLRAAGLFLALAGAAFGKEPPQFQRITVRPGDTLWGIAQTYLKDPTRWDEILRYNKLPTSDPTVALPGTTLDVPVELIREDMRAAHLIYMLRQVLSRKRETADWRRADSGMELFRGDGLRTLADSRAKVEFINKAVLSLDPDSMAILKPPKQEDHDLRLMRGAIHATMARVLTPSALVTPKTRETSYSARVMEDLSTRVQVFKGKADVAGAGKTVEVVGGFGTDVALDRAPAAPVKIPDMAALETEMSDLASAPRAAAVSVRNGSAGGLSAANASVSAGLASDLEQLSLGIPVAAYRIQVAREPAFEGILFQKNYDAEEGRSINLRESGLPKGDYWVRISIIDLLGAPGEYSKPKLYHIGN